MVMSSIVAILIRSKPSVPSLDCRMTPARESFGRSLRTTDPARIVNGFLYLVRASDCPSRFCRVVMGNMDWVSAMGNPGILPFGGQSIPEKATGNPFQ